jgi:flagellin-like hook-associated protein FlgL
MKRFLAGLVLSAALLSPGASAQSSALGFLNRILGEAEGGESGSSERLSGGVMLLADDPASYAIYDSMQAQVLSLGAEMGNGGDLLSYYRLEDAILGNLIDIEQRIRELLAQRAGGILDDSDKEAIDSEIGQLYDEVAYTLANAEFNQKKLFLPTDAGMSGLFASPKFYDQASVDRSLEDLIALRSGAGAKVEALGFTVSGQAIEGENETGALSQGDTDFAKELVELQRSHILALADILMLKREP